MILSFIYDNLTLYRWKKLKIIATIVAIFIQQYPVTNLVDGSLSYL